MQSFILFLLIISTVVSVEVTVYETRQDGFCSDINYNLITTLAECESATAAERQLTGRSVSTIASGAVAAGCLDVRNSDQFDFNSNADSTEPCGSSQATKWDCICKFTSENCIVQDGSAASQVDCLCGSKGACTIAGGAVRNFCFVPLLLALLLNFVD